MYRKYFVNFYNNFLFASPLCYCLLTEDSPSPPSFLMNTCYAMYQLHFYFFHFKILHFKIFYRIFTFRSPQCFNILTTATEIIDDSWIDNYLSLNAFSPYFGSSILCWIIKVFPLKTPVTSYLYPCDAIHFFIFVNSNPINCELYLDCL